MRRCQPWESKINTVSDILLNAMVVILGTPTEQKSKACRHNFKVIGNSRKGLIVALGILPLLSPSEYLVKSYEFLYYEIDLLYVMKLV
jgi:hypothetical protein